MNKYLLFYALSSLLAAQSALSCPCGLSLDDKRPFFEQHQTTENKTVATDANKKEEKK